VIGYLDTSALVPMLIGEPTSDACRELWNTADDVVSSRLVYVEAAAALARAERNGRFAGNEHARAVEKLDGLILDLEFIEVDEGLVRTAARLAHLFGLRGYDAVHCAAAAQLDEPDLVAASGDQRLLAAWRELGVATFDPAAD
jgi:predicted nucleic acid-binding protein